MEGAGSESWSGGGVVVDGSGTVSTVVRDRAFGGAGVGGGVGGGFGKCSWTVCWTLSATCVAMTERSSSRSWSIAADVTSVVTGSEGCGGEVGTGGVAGKIEAGLGGG